MHEIRPVSEWKINVMEYKGTEHADMQWHSLIIRRVCDMQWHIRIIRRVCEGVIGG